MWVADGPWLGLPNGKAGSLACDIDRGIFSLTSVAGFRRVSTPAALQYTQEELLRGPGDGEELGHVVKRCVFLFPGLRSALVRLITHRCTPQSTWTASKQRAAHIMRMPWQLLRNPLSPGVPLEGSDTVQGLRTLERRRMTEMLQQPAGGATAGAAAAAGGGVGGWQRRFQRYRGPFVEQLSTEDLKQAPKNWTVFWKGSEGGQLAQVRVGDSVGGWSGCSNIAILPGTCNMPLLGPTQSGLHRVQAYNLPASLDVLHERTEVRPAARLLRVLPAACGRLLPPLASPLSAAELSC